MTIKRDIDIGNESAVDEKEIKLANIYKEIGKRLYDLDEVKDLGASNLHDLIDTILGDDINHGHSLWEGYIERQGEREVKLGLRTTEENSS